MIVVKRAKEGMRCNSCCTETGVYNITMFRYTGQGTQISLCDACIADIYNGYIKCNNGNHEVNELERDK